MKKFMIIMLLVAFVFVPTYAHATKLKDVTPDQIGNNISTGIVDVASFNYVEAAANGIGGVVKMTLKAAGFILTAPFKALEKVKHKS